jgi:putative transposase
MRNLFDVLISINVLKQIIQLPKAIDCSMSGAGNCYDNTCVENFFGLLKRERVKRVRYRTRDEARANLFDYIEVFYNRKRRYGYLGNISPADLEAQPTGSL